VFDVAEFSVMRQLRRAGVGVAAAWAAFDRLRGTWEVRQRDENPAATAFWRRAVRDYPRGSCDERRWDGPEWTGLVQTFSSGQPAPGVGRRSKRLNTRSRSIEDPGSAPTPSPTGGHDDREGCDDAGFETENDTNGSHAL
jgi:hypothetical protein